MTDSRSSINEWLPNWRDTGAYPDGPNITRQEWAWEFLRRNKRYQHDYNELLSLQSTENSELDRQASEIFCSVYGVTSFDTTPKTPFELMCSHLLPFMQADKERYPWVPEVCWRLVEKYNLKFPVDPSRNFTNGFFIEYDNLPTVETQFIILNKRNIPKDDTITITFDLKKSLIEQLEYTKGIFSRLNKIKADKKRNFFRQYLQILDGIENDKPWNIIARELKLGEKQYHKWRGFAERLRDSEFFILSQSIKTESKTARLTQGINAGTVIGQIDISTLPVEVNTISSAGCTIYIKRPALN